MESLNRGDERPHPAAVDPGGAFLSKSSVRPRSEPNEAAHKTTSRRRSADFFATALWSLISRGAAPGRAHGLLAAWIAWERLARRLWPTIDIPNAPYRVLELRVRPYDGGPVVLPDGVRIEEKTPVAELHCNNRNLLELMTSGRVNPFAAAREDLRSLAAWLKREPAGQLIQAAYGVTILTGAALRLGFTVRSQPLNVRRRLERVYMTGLLLIYTTGRLPRLSQAMIPGNYPQEIWISRDQLIRRYGDRRRRAPVSVTRPERPSLRSSQTSTIAAESFSEDRSDAGQPGQQITARACTERVPLSFESRIDNRG